MQYTTPTTVSLKVFRYWNKNYVQDGSALCEKMP